MDVPPLNKIGMDWVQSHCKEKPPPHIWQTLAHFFDLQAYKEKTISRVALLLITFEFRTIWVFVKHFPKSFVSVQGNINDKIKRSSCEDVACMLFSSSSFWEDVWVRSRKLVMVRKMRISIVLSCEFNDRQGVETWCSNRERCESDLLRKIRHTYTAVERLHDSYPNKRITLSVVFDNCKKSDYPLPNLMIKKLPSL
jgi:hypothetical protein